MPIRRIAWTFCLLTLVVPAATGKDRDNLKAFPPAEAGRSRFVIQLPHNERGEDERFRVEIIVGKQIMTDGVNTYRLGGKIEAKTIKGWGFTRYDAAKFGPPAKTMMAVPPDTPEVKKFVAIPSLTVPYNSRVPLVVYVPEGGEVRYRIWTAAEKTEKAKQG